jgi:hypothetical protein
VTAQADVALFEQSLDIDLSALVVIPDKWHLGAGRFLDY